MDYEKLYKEALGKARQLCAYPTTKPFISDLQDLFPELKESEEEKNIKNLIDELKCSLRAANCQNDACGGGHEKRIALLKWGIAWVEKQGKSVLEAVKEEPIDNANKVEPKFKVGQWIVWQDKCYKVNYNGCGYELVDQNGLSTSLEYGTIDENAHIWDITKDALADVCEALKQEEAGTNSSKKANGNSIGETLVITFANPIDAIVRNHGIQWKRKEVISYNLLNDLAYTKDGKVYGNAALYKGNECFIGTTAVVGNTLKEYVQRAAK